MVTNTKLVELGRKYTIFKTTITTEEMWGLMHIAILSYFTFAESTNLHEFCKDKNIMVAFSFIWNFTVL